MNFRARRCVLTGAALAGAVLMVAGAAYACTSFKGTMTVTGGGGTTKVVGSGSGMTYCSGFPKDTAPAPAGGAHGTSGSTITISVKPSTGCNTFQLPAAIYNANVANGKAFPFTIDPNTHLRKYGKMQIDCMFRGRGVSALTPSTLSVPASGSASGSFKLPMGMLKSGPTDAAAVCVADANGAFGLQAPIIIT